MGIHLKNHPVMSLCSSITPRGAVMDSWYVITPRGAVMGPSITLFNDTFISRFFLIRMIFNDTLVSRKKII